MNDNVIFDLLDEVDIQVDYIRRVLSLPTEPDWNAAPEEFIYFAIDWDGKGTLFTARPVDPQAGDVWWKTRHFNDKEMSVGKFNPMNWRNSLRRKPENE